LPEKEKAPHENGKFKRHVIADMDGLGPRKAKKRAKEGGENSVEQYERRPRDEKVAKPTKASADPAAPAPGARPARPGGGRGLRATPLPAAEKAARKAARLGAKKAARKAAQAASAARPAAEKRREIARIANAVLTDPEKHVARLQTLRAYALDDADALIRKLALASEAAVLRDILPDYRIRPLTARELLVTPTKEVLRTRAFENELLARYADHLAMLEAILNPAGLTASSTTARKRKKAKRADGTAGSDDDDDDDADDDAGAGAGAGGGGANKRKRVADAARRRMAAACDPSTALRCASVLIGKGIRFNHSERLSALLVAQLDAQPIETAAQQQRRAQGQRPSADAAEHAREGAEATAAAREDADERAAVARESVELLFRAERCGEGSLLIVMHIAELVRRRGVRVREGALGCLLAIDRAQVGLRRRRPLPASAPLSRSALLLAL
jgi:hypothetical protein